MADAVSKANPAHGLELQKEMRKLRRDLLDLGNEQGVRIVVFTVIVFAKMQ